MEPVKSRKDDDDDKDHEEEKEEQDVEKVVWGLAEKEVQPQNK